MPLYKVWAGDRKSRKMVVASDYNDLMEKAKVKLGLQSSQRCTFVLECDGTEVDEDAFPEIEGQTLILLNDSCEIWMRESVRESVGSNIPETPAQSTSTQPLNNEHSLYPVEEILLRHDRGVIKGPELVAKLNAGTGCSREERIFLVKVLAKYLMEKCAILNEPSRYEKTMMAQSIVETFPVLKTDEGNGYESFYDAKAHTGFLERYIRQRRSRCPDITPKWRHAKPVTAVMNEGTASCGTGDEGRLRERRPTGANTDELLDLMEKTRDMRRSWIAEASPTVTAIIQRYPRVLDLNKAIECEFRAIMPNATVCHLRDEWRTYRQQILDIATSRSTRNTDLKELLQSVDDFDEVAKTRMSYVVLPFLLPAPPTRGMKRPRLSPTLALNKFYKSFEDEDVSSEQCARQLTASGVTQPMIFKTQGCCWIKADNTAVKITDESCFDDCVEFLMYCFFVFNVEYPPELKLVFGVIERMMNIPPTMRRSVVVDDFMRSLKQ